MTTATDKTRTQWPFFVYGTLRPEHGNSALWRGHATDLGTALVHNHRLTTVGFPYLIPDTGSQTRGNIILPGVRYHKIMAEMDTLEGVDHEFYERVLILAYMETSRVGHTCWTYRPVDMTHCRDLAPTGTDAAGVYDFNTSRTSAAMRGIS